MANKEKGLDRKVFGRLGLCLGAALALFSGALQAKPGLDHQYRGPHYNTEALQLDVLDLQVQALGSPIRMLRSWKNGQWVWNERWQDLKILELNPRFIDQGMRGEVFASAAPEDVVVLTE